MHEPRPTSLSALLSSLTYRYTFSSAPGSAHLCQHSTNDSILDMSGNMEDCINTDSGYLTPFHGLTGHLCTQPLSNASSPLSLGATSGPIILYFIRKTFYICGYILLYLIATFAAAGVGQASAYVAEKWILGIFFAERLKANRDYVEISRQLWVLVCSVGFLIVAVGLLFMRLV